MVELRVLQLVSAHVADLDPGLTVTAADQRCIYPTLPVMDLQQQQA